MQDVADISNADNERQRTDYLCAVYGNNVGHQAEYADRCKLNDHHEDLHGDLVHAVYELADLFALISGCKYARAEEYRYADDRQHICVNHGLHQIIGEDADYDIHDLGSFRRRILERISDACIQNREEALKAVYYYKADNNGYGSRAYVVNKCSYADAADTLEVVKRYNAVHYGKQDNRNDHELEQVNVDGSDRLEILRSKCAFRSCQQEYESYCNAGEHCDDYPTG